MNFTFIFINKYNFYSLIHDREEKIFKTWDGRLYKMSDVFELAEVAHCR